MHIASVRRPQPSRRRPWPLLGALLLGAALTGALTGGARGVLALTLSASLCGVAAGRGRPDPGTLRWRAGRRVTLLTDHEARVLYLEPEDQARLRDLLGQGQVVWTDDEEGHPVLVQPGDMLC